MNGAKDTKTKPDYKGHGTQEPHILKSKRITDAMRHSMHFWRLEQADHLSSGIQNQLGQYSKTTFPQKIQKLARHGLLNLSSTGTWGYIILSSPECCGVFSSIPGLHSLDANSTSTVVLTKISPDAAKYPLQDKS
ncbi:hypothetical protein AAY473_013875 [Plecturocebus cupreus]